jgi:hypothetical protein
LAVGPLAKQPVAPPEEPVAEAAVQGGVAQQRAGAVARDVGAEPLAAEAVPAAAARRQGAAPALAGELQGAVRLSAAVLLAVAWAFRRGRAPPSARLVPRPEAPFAHAKAYLRVA